MPAPSKGELAELRRRGLEVQSKQGIFYVQQGSQGPSLHRHTEDRVKRYVSRFEREGWTLQGTPKVTLVPTWNGDGWKPTVDRKGTATIWVPTSGGIRSDHPWYKPGMDLYRVTAWWTREPRKAQFEISDERVQKFLERDGKLPGNLVLT